MRRCHCLKYCICWFEAVVEALNCYYSSRECSSVYGNNRVLLRIWMLSMDNTSKRFLSLLLRRDALLLPKPSMFNQLMVTFLISLCKSNLKAGFIRVYLGLASNYQSSVLAIRPCIHSDKQLLRMKLGPVWDPWRRCVLTAAVLILPQLPRRWPLEARPINCMGLAGSYMRTGSIFTCVNLCLLQLSAVMTSQPLCPRRHSADSALLMLAV